MDLVDDRRARYEALVYEVVGPLRRYARRRTDESTAEDVVADALVVMWRRLDDVPADGELPWCYAVARRCLANAERSRHRHRRLTERIARLDPPASPVPYDVDPPDPGLHRALLRLRPDDRELLRLWAWEDLAPREIAGVLGITANAVSIRLHRAKSRLATELETSGSAPRKTATGAGQITADDTEGPR